MTFTLLYVEAIIQEPSIYNKFIPVYSSVEVFRKKIVGPITLYIKISDNKQNYKDVTFVCERNDKGLVDGQAKIIEELHKYGVYSIKKKIILYRGGEFQGVIEYYGYGKTNELS